MVQLGTYTPPARGEGDTFKPADHVDKPLIVKVRERREGVITEYTPAPGGSAIFIDLVDLSTGQVARDVMWMNGAQVDGLTPYVGLDPVVIRLEWAQGKSRKYVTIAPASEQEVAMAQQWLNTYGDPFVPQVATMQMAPAPAPAPQQQYATPAPAAQQVPAQQQAPAPQAVQPAPAAQAAPIPAGLGAALGNLTPEQIAQLQQQLGAQPVQGGNPPF